MRASILQASRSMSFVFVALISSLMYSQGRKSPPETPRNSPRASPGLQAEIFAREKAVWDAAQRRDIERFQQLVAPDALMIFTSGVKTRPEYLSSLDSRQIKTFSLEDFKVFMPSKDTALSLYRATISGVFSGKEVPPTTIREASVWVKRNGQWVAVMNQETPID